MAKKIKLPKVRLPMPPPRKVMTDEKKESDKKKCREKFIQPDES